MGNCCSNDDKNDVEQNMNKKAGKRDLKQIPIHSVIRMQALVKGFLTRRMVKKIYGFEMSQGLLMRGTVHIEMEPEKLEEQRARVQAIRQSLPEFEYGRPEDQDYEKGVIKEQRPMIVLQDGSQYEGEWNVHTD